MAMGSEAVGVRREEGVAMGGGGASSWDRSVACGEDVTRVLCRRSDGDECGGAVGGTVREMSARAVHPDEGGVGACER